MRQRAAWTLVGRKEQQDRVEILWSDAACLVVLADGMGGHIDGALAAQTAIDSARRRLMRPFKDQRLLC